MKRKSVLAAGLIAALVGGAAIPALSQNFGQGSGGMGNAPGMMMGNDGDEPGYGGMGPGQGRGVRGDIQRGDRDGECPMGRDGRMGGDGNHWMMGHGNAGRTKAMDGRGFGPMGGSGTMGALLKQFDSNGDGTVSADELRAGLAGELKQYDTNGDGTLSLDEYAALYAQITHLGMVRHFQALDVDGNGQVSASEMNAPADRMEQMQKSWNSRQGAGQVGPGPAMKNDNN